MHSPSVWAGGSQAALLGQLEVFGGTFLPTSDGTHAGRPRRESADSSWGWAEQQLSCHAPLSVPSSPPSPSVVSVLCFSGKPTSRRMRRLAHSSPKSPQSHGIDVSSAPAVKQWRLRLGRLRRAMRVPVPPRAGEQHSPPSTNRHIASTGPPAPGHKTQPDPRQRPRGHLGAAGTRGPWSPRMQGPLRMRIPQGGRGRAPVPAAGAHVRLGPRARRCTVPGTSPGHHPSLFCPAQGQRQRHATSCRGAARLHPDLRRFSPWGLDQRFSPGGEGFGTRCPSLRRE